MSALYASLAVGFTKASGTRKEVLSLEVAMVADPFTTTNRSFQLRDLRSTLRSQEELVVQLQDAAGACLGAGRSGTSGASNPPARHWRLVGPNVAQLHVIACVMAEQGRESICTLSTMSCYRGSVKACMKQAPVSGVAT